jgi:HEAT repeat protein
MPDLDSSGKLTGPNRSAAEKIYDTVLAAGSDNISRLVDLLTDADDGSDHKARYLLHGLAVYVTRPDGDEKARAAFATALALTLGSERPKAVQGFVIRQLHVAGGSEVVATLGKALLDEELCEYAAQALVAIEDGAADQFRKALPRAKRPSRLTIVQALGVLRDEPSIESLHEATQDNDRDTRLAAGWALANIGDKGAIKTLIHAAESDGYERIQATKSCLLLAEKLIEKGDSPNAKSIYQMLFETRKDPSEKYVRDAALRGLRAVSKS